MKNIKIVLSIIAIALAAPQFSFATTTKNVNLNHISSASMQDAAITTYIHARLAVTKNVPNDIGVRTKAGVVKLTGTVSSKKQAHDVIKVALSATGVKVVDASKLKIKEMPA